MSAQMEIYPYRFITRSFATTKQGTGTGLNLDIGIRNKECPRRFALYPCPVLQAKQRVANLDTGVTPMSKFSGSISLNTSLKLMGVK